MNAWQRSEFALLDGLKLRSPYCNESNQTNPVPKRARKQSDRFRLTIQCLASTLEER